MKSGQLTPHFNINEFRCHCSKCDVVIPPSMLLAVLEDVRSHFKKRVNIMSGYRCLAHNTSVGGSKGSKHMEGIAADIIVEDINPVYVWEYLKETYHDEFGIGSYDSFTHIDVRQDKARW